jgi:hypothetical protein
MGNLVIVKILMEEYHCDDGLVASDGQIALRLAAQNGHREVVDFSLLDGRVASCGGSIRIEMHSNEPKMLGRRFGSF